jgi:hypothetical protein
MDPALFDRLTRFLAALTSRRVLLTGLIAALGTVPDAALGKKRKKKVKRNAFGCVNVGDLCKHDRQCCSGICRGKKEKKTCKGHDTGGCRAGDTVAICGGADVACTTSAGQTGSCVTTTGNAGYCQLSGTCFDCTKDEDCRSLCGADAACIRCEGFCVLLGFSTGCVSATDDACTASM